MEVVQKGAGQEPPYTIRQMGIYLVVDTDAGLVLLWDRRTSIFLRLSPEFKVRPRGGPCWGPWDIPEGQRDRVSQRWGLRADAGAEPPGSSEEGALVCESCSVPAQGRAGCGCPQSGHWESKLGAG